MTEDAKTAHDLDGLIVGPDEWLVLSSRHPMTLEQAKLMRDQIPAALAGRVLIVDQMDMAAVSAKPEVHCDCGKSYVGAECFTSACIAEPKCCCPDCFDCPIHGEVGMT